MIPLERKASRAVRQNKLGKVSDAVVKVDALLLLLVGSGFGFTLIYASFYSPIKDALIQMADLVALTVSFIFHGLSQLSPGIDREHTHINDWL